MSRTSLPLASALFGAWLVAGQPAAAEPLMHPSPANHTDLAPTVFLDTETARTLPQGFGYIEIGAGYALVGRSIGLSVRRGLNEGGELKIHGGLFDQGNDPNRYTYEIGVGWKQHLFGVGPFDAAVNGDFAYWQPGFPVSYGVLVGLPLTMPVNPGELTLQPRVVVPDLANAADRLNRSAAGVQIGYQWPITPSFVVLGEMTPSYVYYAGFSAPLRLGARLYATPTFIFEGALGTEGSATGANFAEFENFSLASITVRSGF